MADSLESRSAEVLLTIKNGGLPFKMEEEEQPKPAFAEVLGLKPVGEESPTPRPTPSLVLNRRGMPARIRKRNKLYFDDDIVSIPHVRASPKKTPKATPKKIKQEVEPVVAPDKRIAQKIGIRLRNLLKLPKAHKWVCYEWFYSNIDKALFEGENDFMICLRESFPQLKTRRLTRVEWCKIRRMMGKPRRCSHGFFTEERVELTRKRQKIRLLQQRKNTDISSCRDLPEEIPLQLVIGTKVTARLRKPQDGLFLGSIDAVDTSNNTYRITFDRPGLGTHSIPDFEVLSNEPPDTMPVSSFAQKFRPRALSLYHHHTPAKILPLDPSSFVHSPHLSTHDPVLGATAIASSCASPVVGMNVATIGSTTATIGTVSKRSFSMDGTLGGFPVKFLDAVVRLAKILNSKKQQVNALRDMNAQAEMMRSFGGGNGIQEDFQKRYASIVLTLDVLNKDLREYLSVVQHYCQEIAPEQGLHPLNSASHLKQQSLQEAREMVERLNAAQAEERERECVQGKATLALIAKLVSLMLQIKSLSESKCNPYELRAFQEAVAEVKGQLKGDRMLTFQGQVEIHLQHIQAGLSLGMVQQSSNSNSNSAPEGTTGSSHQVSSTL